MGIKIAKRLAEGVDSHGIESTPVFGPLTPLQGAAMAPGRSKEETAAAGHVRRLIYDAALYCPPGTVLAPGDRVEGYGVVYEVAGPLAVWRNPAGREIGAVADLKAVKG